MADGMSAPISIPQDPGAVSAAPKAVTPPVEAAKPADRPSWLPEKFKTPEDLAKSYVELEKKIGGKPAVEAPKPAAPEAAPKADSLTVTKAEPKTAEAQAAAAVEAAGLDWSALTAEVDTHGKLADESYAKLEKQGIPKALVDDFIEGQKARGEIVRSQVAAEIGGDGTLKEVLGWMADAASTGVITEDELTAYNAAVSGRDKGKALAAVRAMHGRYISENGIKPNLVRGGGVVEGDAYQSMRQLVEDTKTEKYKKDPAERARVEAKLARSKI